MPHLTTTPSGQPIDLDTARGQYEYLGEFLASHGAPSTTFSLLEKLYTAAKMQPDQIPVSREQLLTLIQLARVDESQHMQKPFPPKASVNELLLKAGIQKPQPSSDPAPMPKTEHTVAKLREAALKLKHAVCAYDYNESEKSYRAMMDAQLELDRLVSVPTEEEKLIGAYTEALRCGRDADQDRAVDDIHAYCDRNKEDAASDDYEIGSWKRHI